MDQQTDTSQIKNWRSIITLIIFVITSKIIDSRCQMYMQLTSKDIIVIAPFHIPIYIPTKIWNALLDLCSALRIIPPRNHSLHNKRFRRLMFPMNFITAPLIADLFLLAILAIGRTEVHDGTVG
jgi:hypothetical protein